MTYRLVPSWLLRLPLGPDCPAERAASYTAAAYGSAPHQELCVSCRSCSWHQHAKQACDPYGEDVYHDYKKWCDEYFYLKHRNEPRGVGGLFFDDLNQWGFEKSFAFTQAVGNAYIEAYSDVVNRRKSTAFTAAHKDFQKYRRGRYVEFNLVYDRGTLFGLQSGGRTESILMSLPPEVNWHYDYQAQKNSVESHLYTDFLKPRDWLNATAPSVTNKQASQS